MSIASYRINDAGCSQLVKFRRREVETLQIYFSDLNKEAQEEVLAFYEVSSAEELNLDVVPLIELEKAD
jgi:hypothetical protein